MTRSQTNRHRRATKFLPRACRSGEPPTDV